MKSFLNLVACCVYCKTESDADYSEVEESYLVPAPRRSNRRRKRCPSIEGEEWKPSLTSISENYVAVSVEKVLKERKMKRAAAAHEDAKIQQANDHGRASFSTVLPAFAPTPFMF